MNVLSVQRNVLSVQRDVPRGRAEVEARMEAWNNRRLDAERKGEPFDEPLPIRTKDG